MILLDSNVLINYLNGNKVVITKLQSYKSDEKTLFISAVTVTEVLALGSLSPSEIKVIETFLQEFIVLSVTEEVAKQAAMLRRTYKLSIPDALIVSTAILHSVPLLTTDEKIRKISRLKHAL